MRNLGVSLLVCFSTAQAVLVFDPPYVTEIAPVLTNTANRISDAVPHPSMGDVHWKTTTYPCSTLTTWTSISKKSTFTFTFSPASKSTLATATKGGSTLPHSASTCSAVTVTSKVTMTATATATTTATSTKTATSTTTATSITTATSTTTATSITTATATSTATATATATTTATTTETISSCTITGAPAGPTFSCAPEGFLIQTAALYEVDLTTGSVDTVKNPVTPGGATLNAIGFNVLDNYIYGYRTDAPNQGIFRLSADGSYLALSTVADARPGGSNLGDFGGSGDLWISPGGTSYYVYDLAPGSATYGDLITSGATTGGSGLGFADWVYIPIMGNYLYSMGTNAASGVSVLARFSMATFAWEVVQTYTTTLGLFGALFGVNNGTIIGSDNSSGKIWNIPLDGTLPFVISQGPTSSSNDGARCVNNLAI